MGNTASVSPNSAETTVKRGNNESNKLADTQTDDRLIATEARANAASASSAGRAEFASETPISTTPIQERIDNILEKVLIQKSSSLSRVGKNIGDTGIEHNKRSRRSGSPQQQKPLCDEVKADDRQHQKHQSETHIPVQNHGDGVEDYYRYDQEGTHNDSEETQSRSMSSSYESEDSYTSSSYTESESDNNSSDDTFYEPEVNLP